MNERALEVELVLTALAHAPRGLSMAELQRQLPVLRKPVFLYLMALLQTDLVIAHTNREPARFCVTLEGFLSVAGRTVVPDREARA